MSRSVNSGSVIYSQVDFFSPPGSYIRIPSIAASSVSIKIFCNNKSLGWTVVDGSNIQDSGVSSGNIYFNEITSGTGFYSIRFFPNKIGFWRIIVSHSSGEQILEFDVSPQSGSSQPGLIASFNKP